MRFKSLEEAIEHIRQLEQQLEAMTKLNGIHWNLAMDRLQQEGVLDEEDHEVFHGLLDEHNN